MMLPPPPWRIICPGCGLAPDEHAGRASAADPAGRTGDQWYLPLDPAIANPALISAQDHIGAALRSNYGL